MQSEAINELATALALAQGQMKNPGKSKTARIKSDKGSYEYKYADLAEILDAVRVPLSKNGLSVTQTIEPINGSGMYLRTVLRHTSGQWVSSLYPLPEGARPQELGSALTYGRRYSLSSLVGIASEDDDDANEAQNAKVNTLQRPAADAKALSDEQIEQLMLYAAELDTDRITKFLAWLNVKSIDDIKAHQYERAMAGLRKAVGRTLGVQQTDGMETQSSQEVRE